MLNTDRFMHNLWNKLYADFRFATSFTGTHPLNVVLNSEGIVAFRNTPTPSLWAKPELGYIYKWEYQLANLFKRYRFQKDLLTDRELEDATIRKFLSHQEKLALYKPQLTNKELTRRVLRGARSMLRTWLGDVPSVDDLALLCSFGTKATIGNPKSDAYYEQKCLALSGSQRHITEYRNMCRGDRLLSSACRKSIFTQIESLKQVIVPKSYKIGRGITPNTTTGAFLTKGLGVYLETVCDKLGISVQFTQATHRRIVKVASKHRKFVTADLSSASDSFTTALLNALLPRKWFRALVEGRIANVKIGKDTYRLESVMTMGIGFTFPLETLLFYSILKSIAGQLGIDDFLSVYGDDLIYHRDMHSYVEFVFNDLGLLLNRDKTFVKSHFRESCGADYFNGIDVRPFSPEGTSKLLTPTQALPFLYKMLNGLRARWTLHETRETTAFLLRTILNYTEAIHQVPQSYPDYSGVKVHSPISSRYWHQVNLVPQSTIDCEQPSYSVKFKCVTQVKKYRAINQQHIYLWVALRNAAFQIARERIPFSFNPSFHQKRKVTEGHLRRILALDALRATSLSGDEAMQCIWKRMKYSSHKIAKDQSLKGKRKLKAFEVARTEEEDFTTSTAVLPTWV